MEFARHSDEGAAMRTKAIRVALALSILVVLMTPWLLLLLVKDGRSGLSTGTDDGVVDSNKSPAEQCEELIETIRKGREAYAKVCQEAKTGEEITASFEKHSKFLTLHEFPPKFLRIIQKAPQDPTAIKAFRWLIVNQPVSEATNQAVDVIIEHHLQSDEMGEICRDMNTPTTTAGETFLRTLLARSQKRQVLGLARCTLANHLKNEAESDKSHTQIDKDAMIREAETLWEEVKTTYGDVPLFQSTLSEEAVKALYEIRRLSVGMIAPEIVGTDTDGKSMKLSDYRGKIVVLVFWGFW